MTVTTYRSTDASAPSLTGLAGSLLTVLDACLINGYGSQPAAGWSKPFANSGNLGCYKNGTGGTGFCLAVNDNGPGAGGALEARVTGFQSLSSVSAGSGQFPTSAQMPIGTGQLVVRKSATANSTVRQWTLVADATCFYMFVETGDITSPTTTYAWMFGDFFSYASGDTFNCAIMARCSENSSNNYVPGANPTVAQGAVETLPPFSLCNSSHLGNVISGHFIAESFTGTGGSIPFGKHTDYAKIGMPNGNSNYWYQMGRQGVINLANVESAFGNAFNYPNPADGGLYCAPVFIHHNFGVRGYLKGLWAPLQGLILNHNDTFTGTGNLTGKSFLAQNLFGTSNENGGTTSFYAQCQCYIETSNWT